MQCPFSRSDLKENKNFYELEGGIVLSRVRVTAGRINQMKEIQENSILVRISARFEFIGSQLRDRSFFIRYGGSVGSVGSVGGGHEKIWLKGGDQKKTY